MQQQPPYYLNDEVLGKYLTGNLTKEESEELTKKLEEDPEGRKYLEQMEKIWTLSAGIGDFQRIDMEGDWNAIRTRIANARIAESRIAESRIVEEGVQEAQIPEARIAEAGTKPGAGPEIRAVPLVKMTPGTVGRRILRIAAVFLLASLAAYAVYHLTGDGSPGRNKWITEQADEGVKQISLPDGSIVFLNAGSSSILNSGSRLTYPQKFKGKKRFVRLEGEAYFEIARDEKKPFTVNVSDEAYVDVLGTSFNLRSDPTHGQVILDVLSGRVAFYPRGKKRLAEELGPEDRAVCEKGRVRQSHPGDLNFLSWKTRILEFRNTPLGEVADQLGRHYGKNFRIVDGELKNLALTGTYEKQPLDEVLEEIELVLDVDFEERNDTIQVRSVIKPDHAE